MSHCFCYWGTKIWRLFWCPRLVSFKLDHISQLQPLRQLEYPVSHPKEAVFLPTKQITHFSFSILPSVLLKSILRFTFSQNQKSLSVLLLPQMNYIEKSGGRERPSQGGGTADSLGDAGGMSAWSCPSNNWLGVHERGQGWR